VLVNPLHGKRHERSASQFQSRRAFVRHLIARTGVPLFLSSTFRDMQAEREELLKRVLPQVRKLRGQRHVTRVRWSLTTGACPTFRTWERKDLTPG
jgi:hypothetical protein